MPTRMSAVKIAKFISHNLAKVRRLSEVSCTMSIQPFSHLTVANLSIPKCPFCPKGERTAAAPHHLPPLPPPQSSSSSSSLFPIIHWTYSDSPFHLPIPLFCISNQRKTARGIGPLLHYTRKPITQFHYYNIIPIQRHLATLWPSGLYFKMRKILTVAFLAFSQLPQNSDHILCFIVRDFVGRINFKINVFHCS